MKNDQREHSEDHPERNQQTLHGGDDDAKHPPALLTEEASCDNQTGSKRPHHQNGESGNSDEEGTEERLRKVILPRFGKRARQKSDSDHEVDDRKTPHQRRETGDDVMEDRQKSQVLKVVVHDAEAQAAADSLAAAVSISSAAEKRQHRCRLAPRDGSKAVTLIRVTNRG